MKKLADCVSGYPSVGTLYNTEHTIHSNNIFLSFLFLQGCFVCVCMRVCVRMSTCVPACVRLLQLVIRSQFIHALFLSCFYMTFFQLVPFTASSVNVNHLSTIFVAAFFFFVCVFYLLFSYHLLLSILSSV